MIVPRVGPGGADVLDLALLQAPAGSLSLLIAFRSPILARDVNRLKKLLLAVIEERRLRQVAAGRPSPVVTLPAIATDVATPSVTEACIREGVALLDRRGTVIVHGGPLFIHTTGRHRVERPSRAKLFSGKGCRVVRLLLQSPGVPFKVQSVATQTQTSYVYAHSVLARLEQEGFLVRRSPKSGFQLKDPAGLLKAWIESGEPTAIAIEAFNAPSTRPEALARADEARRAAGVRGIFTLASALQLEEVFASGLPHGIYLSGDAGPVIEALGLRSITPHNFLILRADPAAETEAGGIYLTPRTLPFGEGVALPQLAVDFAGAGGRGPEQARRLLERYAQSLPFTGAMP